MGHFYIKVEFFVPDSIIILNNDKSKKIYRKEFYFLVVFRISIFVHC